MSVSIDMCFCTRNEVDALFLGVNSHQTIKTFIGNKLVECSEDCRHLCIDGGTDSYAAGIALSLYVLQHLTHMAIIAPDRTLYSIDKRGIMSFVDELLKTVKASLNAPYATGNEVYSKNMCDSFWFFKKVCDWMLEHKDDLLVLYVNYKEKRK